MVATVIKAKNTLLCKNDILKRYHAAKGMATYLYKNAEKEYYNFMHPGSGQTYRFIPASFDPNNTDDPLLRPLDWRWDSLTEALGWCDTKIALLRLPLFWQVLSPVHAAAVAARCGLFVNEKENMPLGEAAVRVGEANTVVTDTKDAFAFSLYLAEHNTRLKNWFIIHEATQDWDIPITLTGTEYNVVQEVHVHPGVPVLVQCKELSLSKKPHFHATADYALTASALEVPLLNVGVCACGKEVLAKTM